MRPWMQTLLDAPVLPGVDIADLCRRARDGDARAREHLIEVGLRWVVLHALRMGVPPTRIDDAVQEGVIGLIRAIDRFDPDRGVALPTFAWPWIAGAIRRAEQTESVLVTEIVDAAAPLPDEEGELLSGLRDEHAKVLRLRYGFEDAPMSRRQVASRLGLTERRVRVIEDEAIAALRSQLIADESA